MGIATSKSNSRWQVFSKPANELDWQTWVAEGEAWRSAGTKELDKHGGLMRPPVARGESMTAKLQFLQQSLDAQAQEFHTEFTKTNATYKAQRENSLTGGPGDASVTDDNGPGKGAPTLQQRSKSIKKQATVKASKTMNNLGVRRKPAGVQVADWRFKVHEARRKAMLVLMVTHRFQAGCRNRKRLRRIDSFSYYISSVLQDDAKRFVASSATYHECVAQEEAVRAAADAAAAAEEARLRAIAGQVVEQLAPGTFQNQPRPYKPMLGHGASTLITKRLSTHASQAAKRWQSGSHDKSPPKKASVAPPAAVPWQGILSSTSKPAPAISTRKTDVQQEERHPSPPKHVQPAAVPAPPAPPLEPEPATFRPALAPPLPPQAANAGPPSPARRALLLESLPEQQYVKATRGVSESTALPDGLPDLTARRDLLEPLNIPASNLGGPIPNFNLAPVSKYGHTDARGRSLMSRKMKALMVEKHQQRMSESGLSSFAAMEAVKQVETERLGGFPPRRATTSENLDLLQSSPFSPRPPPGPQPDAAQQEHTPVAPDAAAGSHEQQGGVEAEAAREQGQVPQAATADAGCEPGSSSQGPGAHTPEQQDCTAVDAPNASSEGQDAFGLAKISEKNELDALSLSVEQEIVGAGGNEGLILAAIDRLPSQEAVPLPAELTGGQEPRHLGAFHSSKFQEHLLREHSVAQLLESSVQDEEDAEVDALLEELAKARSDQRKEALRVAQEQLEAQWEEELHAPAAPEAEQPSIETCTRFMNMYVNRGNASWASGRPWAAPTLWDKHKQEEWMSTEDWNIWKARMVHTLRSGGFAVQVLAAGHSLQFPHIDEAFDLWSTDPWHLVQLHRQQQVKDCVIGVPLGIRVITNIATAVEAVGGKAAMAKTPLILHLSPDQFENLETLKEYNFCGLDPRNILILVQKEQPGYVFDQTLKRFVQVPGSQQQVCGSGHGLMQLNWVAEAWQLDKDGHPVKLLGTALEELEARGVEWLVSHHIHDLGLLTRESWCDLVLLPFLMECRTSTGVSALTQVIKEDSLGLAARTNSSVMMAPQESTAPRGTKPYHSTMHSVLPSHPAAGMSPVCELRASELCSGKMKEVVRGVKHAGKHYLVGLDRHTLHIQDLHSVLVSPEVLRPKLTMQNGVLYVSLHLGDISASLQTVAAKARQCATLLLAPLDVEEMVPLLRAQDTCAHFRKTLGSRTMAASQAAIQMNAKAYATRARRLSSSMPQHVVISPSATSSSAAMSATAGQAAANHCGHHMVVFVTSGNLSQLSVSAALAIARPGRDIIHLVTVVSGFMHVEAGQMLLESHYASVARSLVEARQEVLVLDAEDPQLLTTMESYVQRVRADLVIMATKALNTDKLQNAKILGSVTLAALKRFTVPIMIVNSNSSNIPAALRSHHVRAAALVQRHTRPLVDFLCTRLLQPQRGDTLVLYKVGDPSLASIVKLHGAAAPAQPNKPGGSQPSQKEYHMLMLHRALAGMQQAATMSGLGPPVLVSIEDDQPDHLSELITTQNVHLLGYMLPAQVGRIPEQLVHLIHTCKSAILVFRQPTQASPAF